MTLWITVYAVGYLICCVVLNIYWHEKFKEYNVLWAAFGAILWPFLFVFGILGLIGKLIAKPIEKIMGG